MNLHLTCHSDQYSVEMLAEYTILRWRVHMDLSQYKFISLRDFRVKPGHLIDPKKFSLISSNLVKSDVFNPRGIIYCTTSFNHAIANPGFIVVRNKLTLFHFKTGFILIERVSAKFVSVCSIRPSIL